MHLVVELWGHALNRLLGLIPWFLFAVVLSVLLQHMRIDVLVNRSFRKRTIVAIIGSALVGAFSPLCSCTVIPLIRGFLAAGVPVSVAMAFWIASPAIDPEIFGLTAAALGVPVAVARLVGALVLSLAAGFVTLLLERRGWLADPLRTITAAADPAESQAAAGSCCTTESTAGPSPAESSTRTSAAAGGSITTAIPVPTPVNSSTSASGCCDSDNAGTKEITEEPVRWWPQAREGLSQLGIRQFVSEVLRDCWLLGRWMVIAVLLEALIVRFVPPSIVSAGFGGNVVVSVLLAAAIGVPLYLNGVGAIPVVAGLMATGMNPAAATTFLLAGAITTIPAMAAVRVIASTRV
ncbi:MAG: permease, partial [Pseudonocardiaceae bacterium]